MNKAIGLLHGDMKLICQELNCRIGSVSNGLNGKTKGTTILQSKIKKAADFCAEKNNEKILFCKQLNDIL